MISGPGRVGVQIYNGGINSTMIFTGANTYTGGTLVCACATLQLGTFATPGSIVGGVTVDGTFNVVNANTSGITSITNAGGTTQFFNGTSAGAADTPAYVERDLTGLAGFALAYHAQTTSDTRSEVGARFDYRTPVDGATLTLRARRLGARILDRPRDRRGVPGAAGLRLHGHGGRAGGGRGAGVGRRGA